MGHQALSFCRQSDYVGYGQGKQKAHDVRNQPALRRAHAETDQAQQTSPWTTIRPRSPATSGGSSDMASKASCPHDKRKPNCSMKGIRASVAAANYAAHCVRCTGSVNTGELTTAMVEFQHRYHQPPACGENMPTQTAWRAAASHQGSRHAPWLHTENSSSDTEIRRIECNVPASPLINVLDSSAHVSRRRS